MTKPLVLILLVTFGVISMQSCTIQKRKHLRGWHLHSNKIQKRSGDEKSTKIAHSDLNSPKKSYLKAKFEAQSFEDVLIDTLAFESEEVKTKVFKEKEITINSSTPFEFKKKTSPIQLKPDFERPKQRISPRHSNDSDNKKNPWVAKMFGVILGALTGLILLVPIFLVVLLLFGGDYEELADYSASNSKGPFVIAFVDSFVLIMRFGLPFLLGTIMIAFIILLGIFFYAVYGVAGVIIGFLIIILIFVLIFHLLEQLLDFIFR